MKIQKLLRALTMCLVPLVIGAEVFAANKPLTVPSLTVTNQIVAGSSITGSAFYGDASHLTGNISGNAASLTGTIAMSKVTTGVAVGPIDVSSVTTTAYAIGFLGAFSTLPTSSVPEGHLAYQLSDHRLYLSTEAVVGSQSWLKQQ